MERQLVNKRFISGAYIRNRLPIFAAFASVYIIWGSTYYSIKVAIHTLPPFLMASSRFIIAGAVLFLFTFIRYRKLPSLKHWKESAILGFLLLLMGNGGIVWASGKLPSGIIALLITIEPIWVVLLVILKEKGKLPASKTIIGSILGLAGTLILISPGINTTGSNFSIYGLLAVLISTICWAIGSLYAVKAGSGINMMMISAMQMICGGVFMLLVALFSGELFLFDPGYFSRESILAFVYLVIFGSIIGYSSYAFLLNKVSPSQASTYAYVNPFVAVFIGTVIGGEPLSWQVILASLFMIGGVILVLKR